MLKEFPHCDSVKNFWCQKKFGHKSKYLAKVEMLAKNRNAVQRLKLSQKSKLAIFKPGTQGLIYYTACYILKITLKK